MPRKPRFSNPVRLLREALGKTQPEFAKIAGISKTYLQKIELGQRPLRAELAEELGAAFGVTPASIAKKKGIARHFLESPQKMDLSVNVRDWQNATAVIKKWVKEGLHDFVVPKLDVLLEAADRNAAGGSIRHQKPFAIMLRLNRMISEMVEVFGLEKQVSEILAERAAAGNPTSWEPEIIIETGRKGGIPLPSRGKLSIQFRPRKAPKLSLES